MGLHFQDGALLLLDPTSTFGVLALGLASLVALAVILLAFWLALRQPYRKQIFIERMVIGVCLLNLVYIFSSISTVFTASSRLVNFLSVWSGNILVFSLYILELQILQLFEPLSTLITKKRIVWMQIFVIALHFCTFSFGYYLVVLIIMGTPSTVAWIISLHNDLFAAGVGLAILLVFIQNFYMANLLFKFISRKEKYSDLTDLEKEQILYSRKLVLQYLTWVIIITSLDFVILGFFCFGSSSLVYLVSVLLGARIIEIVAGFHYLIQIPFRAATTTTFGGISKKLKGVTKEVLSPVKHIIRKTKETTSSPLSSQGVITPQRRSSEQAEKKLPPKRKGSLVSHSEKDTIQMERPLVEKDTVILKSPQE